MSIKTSWWRKDLRKYRWKGALFKKMQESYRCSSKKLRLKSSKAEAISNKRINCFLVWNHVKCKWKIWFLYPRTFWICKWKLILINEIILLIRFYNLSTLKLLLKSFYSRSWKRREISRKMLAFLEEGTKKDLVPHGEAGQLLGHGN